MMKDSEARRNQERVAVDSLAQQLSSLEAKLTERFAESESSPVKGSLARLEARLETIAKRSSAETAVLHQAASLDPVVDGAAPIRRLEEKLNSLLDAVGARPAASAEASRLAIAAAQGAVPSTTRRSLSDAIGEIVRRQRLLEEADRPVRGAPIASDGRRPAAGSPTT